MDEMEEKHPEEVKKRRFRVKICAAAAIVLVLLLIIGICRTSGDERITIFYAPSQNGVLVLSDAQPAEELIPGKGVSSFRFSGDASACAVLIPENGSYTLYYTNGKKHTVAAKNCTNQYVIAYSGKAVVYTDALGVLYQYDAVKNKTNTISDSADRFAVSPDGSRILFSRTEEGKSVLYLYENGAALRLGEQYVPLAVSDDGTYLYVLSADQSFCLLNRDGTLRSKLCSQTNLSTKSFCFSADVTSVVFSDASYTYISHEGKSRIRIISGIAEPALQTGTVCDSYGLSYLYRDNDLTDIFYASYGETGVLFAVNAGNERMDIAGSVSQFTSAGESSLVYVDVQGRLNLYRDGKNEQIAGGVKTAQACKNGKYVYYVTSNGDLFAYKNGKTEKIATDVDEIYMTADDTLLFLLTDGSLYASSGLHYGERVDDAVHGCYVTETAVFYSKNYSAQSGLFTLYSSSDSGHFKKAFDDVSWIM